MLKANQTYDNRMDLPSVPLLQSPVIKVGKLTSFDDPGIKRGGWLAGKTDNKMAMSFRYSHNRRKYHRYPYPSKLGYRLASKASQMYEASTINISAGGLCLSLNQHLPVGQRIEIGVNILPVFCKTARVCWIKKTADDSYIAGLEFCAGSKNKEKLILDAALA